MSDEPKRGRPKKYAEQEYGAPRLTIRVDPDVHQHVTSQPEGARLYIERVVREDRDRSEAGVPLTRKQEQAAEA